MKIDFENSNKLYYTIKEVAAHFDVNVSLLRYWEDEFDTLRPKKTPGGTRQYTKKDIDNIAAIYHLVREKGLRLEGARLKLNQKKDEVERKMQVLQRLERIRKELKDLEAEFGDL